MSQQSAALRIEATPPGGRQQALQLMRLGNTRIKRLLSAAHRREVDMQGLFHAQREKAVVGAAWGQVVPGRSAFCWPACLTSDEPEQTADLLQSAVDRYLAQAGTTFTQAIISAGNVLHALRLNRAGYHQLADLQYLVSSEQDFPVEQPPSALTFLASGQGSETRIRDLIDRTYQDTLDCAALDGVRSTDDVLIGYRHTGVFRPEWWIIAHYRGHDVGCVLLAEHPEYAQCELMYLGVIPEMRGRGWGRQLTQYAQWLASGAALQRMVLAVDEANWPAQKLYERMGFETWDRRIVYVRTARHHETPSPSPDK